MNACILFIFAAQLAWVTPDCYVDKNTMIEPSSIVYLTEYDYLSSDLLQAPQAYHDYWSFNGVSSDWDPDVYLSISSSGLAFVYEPWREPDVRIRFNHYERHQRILSTRSSNHLRRWRENRRKIRGDWRAHKRLRKKNKRMHKRLRNKVKRERKRVLNTRRPHQRQKRATRKDRRNHRRFRSHRRNEGR